MNFEIFSAELSNNCVLKYVLKLFVFICLFPFGYDSFESQCLKAHNKLRQKHQSPELILDSTLQNYSNSYVRKLAYELFHLVRSDGAYGENLYLSSGITHSAETTVSHWYSGIKGYNFKNPKKSKGKDYLRFTQVVWKSSKRLGCAYCRNGDTVYAVANYDPPGNIDGLFEENVLSSSNTLSFTFFKFCVLIFVVHNSHNWIH